jgi:hypothetical protein
MGLTLDFPGGGSVSAGCMGWKQDADGHWVNASGKRLFVHDTTAETLSRPLTHRADCPNPIHKTQLPAEKESK